MVFYEIRLRTKMLRTRESDWYWILVLVPVCVYSSHPQLLRLVHLVKIIINNLGEALNSMINVSESVYCYLVVQPVSNISWQVTFPLPSPRNRTNFLIIEQIKKQNPSQRNRINLKKQSQSSRNRSDLQEIEPISKNRINHQEIDPIFLKQNKSPRNRTNLLEPVQQILKNRINLQETTNNLETEPISQKQNKSF